MHTHYYVGASSRKDIYRLTENKNVAATFTEWESKVVAKALVSIYKDHSDINGTLLKIEVLNKEEWKVVSMCKFDFESKPKPESELVTTRFELMDLEK